MVLFLKLMEHVQESEQTFLISKYWKNIHFPKNVLQHCDVNIWLLFSKPLFNGVILLQL